MLKSDVSPKPPLGPLMRAAAVAILGLVVAWSVLSLAGFWQKDQWPAAPYPFGVQRVLVVHLLCVLPFALWAGRRVAELAGTGTPLVRAGVLAGLAVAALSLWAAQAMHDETVAREAPMFERHGLRLAWVGLLLFPWSAAAAAIYVRGKVSEDATTQDQSRDRTTLLVWVDGVIAALFAFLAVIHVQQTIDRHSALVADAAVNQQSLRALQISEQLAELGSSEIAGRPASEVLGGLREQVDSIQRRLQVPLPSDATLEMRLRRASDLHHLSQLDEAQQVLQGFDDDPRAQLRLALISEARHQYAQAASRYARTIEQISERPNPDAEQIRLLKIAVERRVNNLRRIGDYRQAELELQAGLERWPQVEAALLMQLGFHYQLAGRIGEAIDHFQRAAAVDPRLKPQADATLNQLQLQAEGCLLRPTRGVTR